MAEICFKIVQGVVDGGIYMKKGHELIILNLSNGYMGAYHVIREIFHNKTLKRSMASIPNILFKTALGMVTNDQIGQLHGDLFKSLQWSLFS